LGTVLIGYDTESGSVYEASVEPAKILEKSISAIVDLHVELEVPATFFIVGKTIEMGHRTLKKLREHPDLFDLQQHTYSHLPLKSVNPDSDTAAINNDTNVVGGSLRRISAEVKRTSELLRRHLDAECTGIRGPWGYYRGLLDRPDIVRLLAQNGIEFTSTYLRNRHDGFPLPLSVQPFDYSEQGSPGVVEIPSQDWIDCQWRVLYGWARTRAFARHLTRVTDRVSGSELVWGTCFHDWSVITLDPELSMMRALFTAAKDLEVDILSYKDYHHRFGSKFPAARTGGRARGT
jgi:peptidoglycan/xylan/chitin deacetylase (PgdA/CDA1 family)